MRKNYGNYSAEELNKLLPVESIWIILKNEGHVGSGKNKFLNCLAKCKNCGKEKVRRWKNVYNGATNCTCVESIPFDGLSIDEINELLPKKSNWKFVESHGYELHKSGSRFLMVTVECKCGARIKRRWTDIKNNMVMSCGCVRKVEKSIFENVSVSEMNERIPSSNWTFVSLDGFEKDHRGFRVQMVLAKCKCGKICRKKWVDISKKHAHSCGCFNRVDKSKRETFEPIDGEIWKDVVGFEDFYEISNFGRIRTKPRYLSLKPIKSGYVALLLTDTNGKKKSTGIHRLVAEAFIENPENKEYVNHKNGIRNDNRLENLEWCTPKENSQHAWGTNLCSVKVGSDASQSKITESDVIEIRSMYKPNQFGNMNTIMQKFNLSRRVILSIATRKTWKHVK